jgi:hypothetical protein
LLPLARFDWELKASMGTVIGAYGQTLALLGDTALFVLTDLQMDFMI